MTVALSQLFERGGKRALRGEAADLALAAVRGDAAETRRQQGVLVASAYYDLLFAQETAVGSNAWGPVGTIAAPVSDPSAQESQPFLDGSTLLFRRELALLASDWNGGPLDQTASWTAPREILVPGADAAGAIVAVGEPSVATTAHGRELYFVFARDAGGYLDLDIAMVPAR